MTADTTKCIDLVGSGSALGERDAPGREHLPARAHASQKWSISPDAPTGAFVFKNVQAGRCLDENGANTASGVPMQISDCTGAANQKFTVQAY